MTDTITFLIKPASGSCNMRCKYCFYEDETEHRERKNYGMMTVDTAKNLIRKGFEAIRFNGQINFAFQGGEPTLAGLEFYEKFVEYVDTLSTDKTRVEYAIQTNGYKIDLQWAEFFRGNDFLVGISVDGSSNNHDKYRIDVFNEGTFARVVQTVELFRKTGLRINALCVVTGQTDPFKSYSQLKKLGFDYIQYIPCLDPYDCGRGQMEYSLTPEYYKYFLCNVFDLWYNDWKKGKYVSVRLFDDYVHMIMGLGAGTCASQGRCGAYFVTEADGTLFPCDFYVTDKWILGNINESDDEEYLKKLFSGEKMQSFLAEGKILPEDCRKCRYLNLCNGGCKRDRDYCGTIGKNYFCETYKAFFEYAGPRLLSIAKAEYQFMRQQQETR